jgi:ABC-type uncharacterized transport system substrate-binding protein
VPPALEALSSLTQSFGITIISAPFATPDDLAAYLKAHDKNPGFDAILTIPEPLSIVSPFIDQIYVFADAHGMAMGGAVILGSDKGPIFSLIPDAYSMGRLAAPLADKIFKGTSAGEIPIVTPDFVFQINDKAVQRLHVKVSDTLLSTADKVVH